MKILLVEDDARTADFILKGLQQSGYSTVHAATGPDGLFKAETEECDLAIIDIMLPGMDGFTLIEKLRADRITMPVIVLSAKNSVADKIRGLQNGGDDYLVKPFSFSELVARIQALLAKVQAALDARRGDLDPELPVVELDGCEYVGYVEIPTLEVELPVMADWDYDRLKIAPCRQFGSSRTDDLVIAAHNYQTHFGRLKELQAGDTVRFTDMEGIVNTYAVVKCETLQPTEVDAVQNSGYDLVLYTCTLGGRTRVTVFCDRVE